MSVEEKGKGKNHNNKKIKLLIKHLNRNREMETIFLSKPLQTVVSSIVNVLHLNHATAGRGLCLLLLSYVTLHLGKLCSPESNTRKLIHFTETTVFCI